MTKKEFEDLLDKLAVPVSESTPKDDEMEEEIRIHYWDYNWEDNMASGQDYNTIVTYQVSVVADKPRHPKLLKLKKMLNESGYHPSIQHEYLVEQKRVHSFFSIDVLENIGVEKNE